MNRPNYTRAANEAARLLKKYGFYDPPVDPEKIAEGEGLNVIYAEFEFPDNEKVSGFFRLSDHTVCVNDEISSARITFTIAHEMAHFFLHQDYIKGNNYIPMPRNNEYDGAKPIEEIEADTFAANLLVPLPMLRKYMDVGTIGELARLFFVSEEVIRNRIDLLKRYPNLAA